MLDILRLAKKYKTPVLTHTQGGFHRPHQQQRRSAFNTEMAAARGSLMDPGKEPESTEGGLCAARRCPVAEVAQSSLCEPIGTGKMTDCFRVFRLLH